MFGRMTATPLVRLDAGKDLEVAVAELQATTEFPQIARWIQFPTAVALFLLVPNDPESGAIYFYDRRDGVWYWADIEDQKYSGYNLAGATRLRSGSAATQPRPPCHSDSQPSQTQQLQATPRMVLISIMWVPDGAK